MNRYNVKSLIRCASLCLHDMSCATVTYTPASQLCSLSSICQFTSEDCSASLSVTGLYKPGQCKYNLQYCSKYVFKAHKTGSATTLEVHIQGVLISWSLQLNWTQYIVSRFRIQIFGFVNFYGDRFCLRGDYH